MWTCEIDGRSSFPVLIQDGLGMEEKGGWAILILEGIYGTEGQPRLHDQARRCRPMYKRPPSKSPNDDRANQL